MKFDTVYLGLILSSILSTAICSTGSEELDVCKRACNEFISKANTYIDNADRSQVEFDALIPYWTTCQYRCYRCHLPLASYSMGQLPKVVNYPWLNNSDKKVLFEKLKTGIAYSIEETCYRSWEIAIEENDKITTFGYITYSY